MAALMTVGSGGVVVVGAGVVDAAEVRLVEFAPPERRWVAVNDGVMGGVSSGSVTTKDGVATFRGRVRLENNGGFASMRSSSAVPVPPEGWTGFLLRVRGDGRTYQFTVDTDRGWFWAPIRPSKSGWSTVTVGFDDLVPVTRFGEPDGRDGFDGTEQVEALGVLISNKKAEPFVLSLDWIAAR
jgi:NADH dehydrogenase [ubiquinone] 1 alpha subcomplex assembly factor 1